LDIFSARDIVARKRVDRRISILAKALIVAL